MVVCEHAYLVLKEPAFALRAMAGKSVDGLPDVALAKSGSLISYLVENGLVRFDGGL